VSEFFTGVSNEQLAASPIFEGLDEAALDRVRECTHFIGAHPGLHIVRQGEGGFELYIIVSGTAEVMKDGETVATLGKGDVFGEMSLLGNSHRNADVVARSVMSLVSLTADEFRRLAEDVPEIERRVRDIAEGRRASA